MSRRRAYIFFGLLLGFTLVAAFVAHHASPRHIRAQWLVEQGDMGIPGITKIYNATLTNNGTWPVPITRCDFIDDTMSHGSMVAYAIQRWNNAKQQWEQVLGSSRRKFCHPYPLGIIKADLKSSLLWPGRSLSIGEEATAARDGIQIGDRLRFVLFLAEPGDYSASIPTEAFVIDEHSSSDVDFRIRH